MSSQKNVQETQEDRVNRALNIANDLCNAVLRGDKGQQRLALDFARVLDDARKDGQTLIK